MFQPIFYRAVSEFLGIADVISFYTAYVKVKYKNTVEFAVFAFGKEYSNDSFYRFAFYWLNPADQSMQSVARFDSYPISENVVSTDHCDLEPLKSDYLRGCMVNLSPTPKAKVKIPSLKVEQEITFVKYK